MAARSDLPTTAAICHSAAAEFLRTRQVRRALTAADEAERLGANPDDCSAIRWDCWMLLGVFERAWAESDAIAARGTPDPHRVWDGSSFNGKRVILRCLHGLGDTIQFIRYAPLLRSGTRSLTVQTHPELVRLLQNAPGIDEVITWDGLSPDLAPEWDSQIEINELPRVFRTTLATIPADVPYLKLKTPRALRPGRPRKIGLIWESSQWNPARSIPSAQMASALSGTGVELFSLQHGVNGTCFQSALPIDGDVLDTARAMLTMDLIISADTMTAHLAGALALPVWVLLPFEADWRWMLDRLDSPWYPTMRLFRQSVQGDWESPLLQLRTALQSRT